MTDPDSRGIGAVVLAAGSSLRLGQPKQLLAWRGEPLVRRAARGAVEAGLWPVVVVVGAHADEVRLALAGLPVATVTNRDHGTGLASSLRRGLARLDECAPGLAGAVILGCDQPLVPPAHLSALAATLAVGRDAAASTYGGTRGLPASFAAALFPALRALEGDAGPCAVLGEDPERFGALPLPHGEIDVDTPEDWARARLLEEARR